MKWDDWVKTRKVQLKAKRKKKNQEGLGRNTEVLIQKKYKKDWVETRKVWFKKNIRRTGSKHEMSDLKTQPS